MCNSNNSAKKEIYNLTSIRFIAALYVFLFHCQIHLGHITNIDFVNRILNHGAISMSLFFVLSGYILALSYNSITKENIHKYYINRIARIYPTYIIYGLIGIYFLVNNFENVQAMSSINTPFTQYIQFFLLLITFVLMFQAWFPSMFSIWNFGGSWSLSVEAFFYSLYPLIRHIVNTYSTKVLYLLFLISYFWASLPAFYLIFFGKAISFQAMSTYVYVSPIFRLGEFIFGVLFYVIFVERNKILLGKIKFHLILSLSLLFYFMLNFNALGLTSLNFIVIPTFGILIYYLHVHKNFILENKIFIYLGKISYSFYLAQFFVFVLLKTTINDMGGGLKLNGLVHS